jgi:hypothetical protein
LKRQACNRCGCTAHELHAATWHEDQSHTVHNPPLQAASLGGTAAVSSFLFGMNPLLSLD